MNGVLQPSRNENNNLTLTHNLHSLHYRSDGGGRDAYVYYNNGGLNSYQVSNKLKSDKIMSGRFLPSQNLKESFGCPARPIHYVSDGSGRDSYVCNNDGGFSNRSIVPRLYFDSTLRTYGKLGDYIKQRRRSSVISITGEKISNQNTSKVQTSQIDRSVAKSPVVLVAHPFKSRHGSQPWKT